MERCFFLGHRDAERTLLTALETVTEKLAVQEHVQEFYVGEYGNFDEMAAEAVLSLKAKHPRVRLYRGPAMRAACWNTRSTAPTGGFCASSPCLDPSPGDGV